MFGFPMHSCFPILNSLAIEAHFFFLLELAPCHDMEIVLFLKMQFYPCNYYTHWGINLWLMWELCPWLKFRIFHMILGGGDTCQGALATSMVVSTNEMKIRKMAWKKLLKWFITRCWLFYISGSLGWYHI